jgi:uncharacterized protein involved in copper resistance
MSRFVRVSALLGTLAFASPLAAQTKPAPKDTAKAGMAGMDHSKMAGMDHNAMHAQNAKGEAWKELDAYHALMMATWHPAKDKNDLAPIRAKATEMVASAKVVAASKAPASCGGKAEVTKAQAALPAETEKVAKLVAAKASDADLKAGLKTLHDKFDVLEEGCGAMEMHEKKDKK